MAILRKPGTVIPLHLPTEAPYPPGDRVVVWARVPDKGTYLQCEEICGANLGNYETARRVIGLLADRIENLKRDDGKDFKLEIESGGYLTDECATWLSPYLNEIATVCLNAGKLTPVDRKNCSSP